MGFPIILWTLSYSLVQQGVLVLESAISVRVLHFFSGEGCGRQNTNAQRCPCPNPQNLWIYYLIWERNFANVTKDNKVWLDILGQADPKCNHKNPYKWKREPGDSESEKEGRMKTEVRVMRLLALMMEGAVSQGTQAPSGSWTRQGNGYFPRGSRMHWCPLALPASWFWVLWDPFRCNLPNCEMTHVLFKATKCVIICYSSNKELIQIAVLIAIGLSPPPGPLSDQSWICTLHTHLHGCLFL